MGNDMSVDCEACDKKHPCKFEPKFHEIDKKYAVLEEKVNSGMHGEALKLEMKILELEHQVEKNADQKIIIGGLINILKKLLSIAKVRVDAGDRNMSNALMEIVRNEKDVAKILSLSSSYSESLSDLFTGFKPD